MRYRQAYSQAEIYGGTYTMGSITILLKQKQVPFIEGVYKLVDEHMMAP
jgi:hypothetical protein